MVDLQEVSFAEVVMEASVNIENYFEVIVLKYRLVG